MTVSDPIALRVFVPDVPVMVNDVLPINAFVLAQSVSVTGDVLVTDVAENFALTPAGSAELDSAQVPVPLSEIFEVELAPAATLLAAGLRLKVIVSADSVEV